MDEPKEQLKSLRVSKEVHESVKALAKREGRTVNKLIELMYEKYVKEL